MLNYINNCGKSNGGFSSRPAYSSTYADTFYAVATLELLNALDQTTLQNAVNYIAREWTNRGHGPFADFIGAYFLSKGVEPQVTPATPIPTPQYTPQSTPTPTFTPTSGAFTATPTLTPTLTPSNTRTGDPTHSPTPTPTFHSTNTPTPPQGSSLKIMLAGYWGTNINSGEGGCLRVIALPNSIEIANLMLAYQGISLGIQLKDDGMSYDFAPNDRIYGFGTFIQPEIDPWRILLEIQLNNRQGFTVFTWPFLIVK